MSSPAAGAGGVRAGLAIGPLLACIGIAWTAIAPSAFSSAAVLAGLLASFYATHRFGRTGVDRGGLEEAGEARSDEDDAERLRHEREEARARARRGEGA